MPPPPPYGPAPGGSDEYLTGLLVTGEEEPYPAAALMARHWQPVSDYLALFTHSDRATAMLTSAAFDRALEGLRGTGAVAALRPYLLATARQVAEEWASDPRVTALLDGPRPPRRPAENRLLVARAFQAMTGPAQVLLWHTEVEAEGISIPAALLATDPRRASGELAHARDIFRSGCASAHRELAPDQECRHFSRLLDISLRRGTDLIPDIERHLARCRYCRYAADQLRQTGGRLPLLLAEAVLGEGDARRYLDTRPGRNSARTRSGSADGRGAGRHTRTTARASGRRGVPRRIPLPAGLSLPGRPGARGRGTEAAGGGALLVGLGIVMTGVLVAAAVAGLRPSGHDTAGPAVSGDGAPSARPAPGSRPSASVVTPAGPTPGNPPPAATPPPTSAAHPSGGLLTRLRNEGTGLCLDVRDGRPALGAELTLANCSGSPTQQWTYAEDGLLRNAAAPDFCPGSQEPAGVVVLRSCAGRTAPAADSVRYDLTVQGQVIPRWNDALALAPATMEPATSVVVRVRDRSAAQRWLTDSPAAAPRPRRAAEEVGDAGPGAVEPPGRTAGRERPGARPSPAGPGTGENRPGVRRAGGTGPGPGPGGSDVLGAVAPPRGPARPDASVPPSGASAPRPVVPRAVPGEGEAGEKRHAP
ncbi:RICIN domain-containing protein [Streptomyces sp. SP18CS02]|uniref:RICIN domain-containing protein n=1 Tax=Streptomyces sp. SP18CS02 TaxID=3002531 RepID=UPI002E77C6D6|nr:RICIN domain-containing protein [Streptomyces sp. SP18CS02]MEE1755841.1 RICIN domain-containing protein [Streptomyces sp. SP18CS02]